MVEIIKLQRSLIGSFLVNVEKVINFTYPENKDSVIETLRLLEKIKKEITEQDGEKERKQKFKQINLL